MSNWNGKEWSAQIKTHRPTVIFKDGWIYWGIKWNKNKKKCIEWM